MKEDYLWDKTGEDPEIERLENALAVFRYQATDAPALPAQIVPFETRTPRRSFFRLTLAFGAFAAFAIVSLGVWLQLPSGKIETAKDSPEIIAPQVIEKVTDAAPITKPHDSVVGSIETPKQSVERGSGAKNTEAAQIMLKPARSKGEKHAYSVRVSANSFQKPSVKLTKEEKYAYDQLMLALSVTSSAFKKVKDKIESVEEKTIVRKNGR